MDFALIERLNRASINKFFIPERDIAWCDSIPSDSTLVPDEILSLYGLVEFGERHPRQHAELARHEVGCLFSFAIRLENVLVENFARLIRASPEFDADTIYYMHEIEEEARHGRMFAHAVNVLGCGAYPARGIPGLIERAFIRTTRWPAIFLLFTLASEELSDHLFGRALASAQTHPMLRDVARVHRIEEARHIRFGHELFVQFYRRGNVLERAFVRWMAPVLIAGLFDFLVRPEVYTRSGWTRSRLQAWMLWLRARRSPHRSELRRRAAARLTTFLEGAGLIGRATRVGWILCGLLRAGPRLESRLR